MTMEGPKTSPQEKGIERVLTREEVLFQIAKYCENPTVKKELSD